MKMYEFMATYISFFKNFIAGNDSLIRKTYDFPLYETFLCPSPTIEKTRCSNWAQSYDKEKSFSFYLRHVN